jgi:microcystin-dependent protein
MAQPYVGEIRMFAGSFAPNGWMLCQGQTLAISENDVLFQLIGTTYGGDGQETFNLPDLQSRVPIHMGTAKSGTTYQIGETGGVETVTLSTQQIPIHTHAPVASANIATQQPPTSNLLAQSTLAKMYIGDIADQPLAANTVQPAGGSQPHENLQPYLCINFIISLFGIFPSQT